MAGKKPLGRPQKPINTPKERKPLVTPKENKPLGRPQKRPGTTKEG
jgi:hypothetical protein